MWKDYLQNRILACLRSPAKADGSIYLLRFSFRGFHNLKSNRINRERNGEPGHPSLLSHHIQVSILDSASFIEGSRARCKETNKGHHRIRFGFDRNTKMIGQNPKSSSRYLDLRSSIRFYSGNGFTNEDFTGTYTYTGLYVNMLNRTRVKCKKVSLSRPPCMLSTACTISH